MQGLSIEGQTTQKTETVINESRYIFKGRLTIGSEGSEEVYPFSLSVDAPSKMGYSLLPSNITSFSIGAFSKTTVELGVSLKNIEQSILITANNYKLEGVTKELFSRDNASVSNHSVSYETITCETACELAEELHPEILQRAVELAKIFYNGDNQQVMTAGTRSE